MDRNTVIGITLITILFMILMQINAPTPEQMEREAFLRDSIERVKIQADSLSKLGKSGQTNTLTPETLTELDDSTKLVRLQGKYGAFAPAASGEDKEVFVENDVMRITFTTKGAKIKEVWLKDYKKSLPDQKVNPNLPDLKLLEDEKNKWEYILPVPSALDKKIYTNDLYFTPEVNGKTISLKAKTLNGGYFEQKYTLQDGKYLLDYDLNFVGLEDIISRSEPNIQLNWVNYMDKLEKYAPYEASYSSVYFKETDDDPDYCSCRGNDEINVEKPVKWVSHAQQFFNSSLIADKSFASAELATEMLANNDEDLKKITSKMTIPLAHSSNETFGMQWYLGPNKYKELKSYGIGLQEIIPFGWSIFGWVNRHVILPMFDFLAKFISNYGLVILVLTVILKTLLYPLQYKMLYSQMKMRVLKPELEKLKDKFGEDKQGLQMEQMKLYRDTGASPFSGCLPIFLQMPVWIALYRFFPAAIEFRQQPFLWADDLSTYDSLINLGFNIPIMGVSHLSLFTILWVISTIAYTYYNSKDMDFSAQPMMKYVQYLMPVMFIFIFNNYASGLTAYLFMSSLINISQIIITKNIIIDEAKVKAEIDAYRKKPKKKGGFQERLQEVMKEQAAQRAKLDQEQAKKRKKGKKK